ncbi:MAG TPA: gamma-glutamyltransferase [Gemmatimonadales bacterium]|nr:gamma-glutamyltransferase [Gemmatimonadales bacterium]
MPRPGALLLAVLAAGCGAPGAGLQTSSHRTFPAAWRYQTPPAPVAGRYAMVVSDHPRASEVGVEVLRRGGNAVDAAVAVAFALAVVHPRAGNIGGGGFLVYRAADGRDYALDFRETAPAAARADMYVGAAGPFAGSVTGARAAGVPGSVAGLAEMHRRFGRLPWSDLVAPAVDLARDGVVLDAHRAAAYNDTVVRRLRLFPSSVAALLPGGRRPRVGDTLRQPDLARTLEAIADSGPDVFYRGHVAEQIVAEMHRSGGIITLADLRGYRARWRAPLETTYRGWGVIGMPPPSSGGVTLAEILNILEASGPLPRYGSAALMHLEIEAMRRAFADRNTALGDPDFVTMPVARLTSKSYAAALARGVDDNRATPTGDVPAVDEGQHTTHFSVVDPEGNAAAVTTTLNDDFGSALVVDGAGFLLNDEMDDFTTRPGAPNLYGLVQGEANAIAPGKRMLSAMAPTVVLDPAGRLALVTGSPGGPRIISAVAQVVSNLIDQGMSLEQAIAAPRIHHQAQPDSVYWERGGLTADQRRVLAAMGYRFRARPLFIGDVNTVLVTPQGLQGLADPRRGGGAAGW